jgi:glycosyltransferase involved in cell wall biosynthesis
MSAPIRVAVVVPAFREEARIAEVVQAARRFVDTVVVIDDCSPDQTSARAAEAGAIVLRHEVNRGKGAGLKTAFAKLAELGFTHGITMDGDGQHDAEQLPAFLEALREPGVSLVLGNRFSNPKGMPFVRRMVNASMSWLISRMCRCPIPDSQCGYRGVAVANPAVLAAKSDHYDYETEVLVLTARARGAIRSIPVRTIYRGETSKIRPVRDTLRFFKLLRRI